MSIISVSLLAVESLSDISPLFVTGLLQVILWKILYSFASFLLLFLSYWLFLAGSCCCTFHEYLHCWIKSSVWHRNRQGSTSSFELTLYLRGKLVYCTILVSLRGQLGELMNYVFFRLISQLSLWHLVNIQEQLE